MKYISFGGYRYDDAFCRPTICDVRRSDLFVLPLSFDLSFSSCMILLLWRFHAVFLYAEKERVRKMFKTREIIKKIRLRQRAVISVLMSFAVLAASLPLSILQYLVILLVPMTTLLLLGVTQVILTSLRAEGKSMSSILKIRMEQ